MSICQNTDNRHLILMWKYLRVQQGRSAIIWFVNEKKAINVFVRKIWFVLVTTNTIYCNVQSVNMHKFSGFLKFLFRGVKRTGSVGEECSILHKVPQNHCLLQQHQNIGGSGQEVPGFRRVVQHAGTDQEGMVIQ